MKDIRALHLPWLLCAAVSGAAVGGLLLRPSLTWLVVGGAVGVAALGLALLKRWSLIAVFIALPPGVVALFASAADQTANLLLVITVACGFALLVGGRTVGNRWFAAGYGGLVLLMAASYFLGRLPDAVGTKLQFLTFLQYGALYLAVANAAPQEAAGRLSFVRSLHTAVLVSVLATGVIAVWQLGGGLLSGLSVQTFPDQPGFLYSRTHFGYFMAIGLAVALPRWGPPTGPGGPWGWLTIASSALVVMSLTRGAWVSAILMTLVVALITRRRGLLLVLPAAVLLALVPAIQTRLVTDFAGGVLASLNSGAAGSSRLLLWRALMPEALSASWLGHGAGFMTTLSAERTFGAGQFVSAQNPLLYAHNDLLYLLIELGFSGLAAYCVALVGWWGRAVSFLRTERARHDSDRLALALTCVGVGLVTFVAQMVDNGFAIRAVYERFAVVAATLFVLQPAKAELKPGTARELTA